ncbi:MAG: DegV family protein [Oscillospiraceae bacterium]|jgi:DegV family protein with EDD domain|nr:DegV family protein [Oscillospiraceae bacterium]
MKIKVTMDSACDLTPELLAKYNIGVLPMTIVCAGREYKDGVDFTADDLFARTEGGDACTTSAINVAEFEEFFGAILKEYDAIIHIDLSSEISACHQNAVIAGADRPVYAVDSRSLSSGAGMLAVDAAIMAAEGLDAETIAAKLRELTAKIETSFVIDSLKYLHRGGRCSSVAALGANILKLKPCIEMKNGKMDVGKKYRGSFDINILQYVRDKLQGREDIDYTRIFMTHANGVSDETLENVRKTILECGPFEEIHGPIAGCTISNHCGPVTLGILYHTK